MSRDDRQLEAMRQYARALAIADPIRIRMWAEAELTTSQLRLLFRLREEPGATLGSVAAYLRVSPPTASGLVDRLVRQDFLRREDDPRDHRYVRHYLNDRGLAAINELEREGRALMSEILGRLSDSELDGLIRSLELLNGAAEGASSSAEAI